MPTRDIFTFTRGSIFSFNLACIRFHQLTYSPSSMKRSILTVVLLILFANVTSAQEPATSAKKVMDGLPPTRESLVTFSNYRELPFGQWSFPEINRSAKMIIAYFSSQPRHRPWLIQAVCFEA